MRRTCWSAKSICAASALNFTTSTGAATSPSTGRDRSWATRILDLERIGLSLRDYIDALEGAVIRTVARYGIRAGRIAGASGVWIEGAQPARKICAIGVRASRYVTMHGFALNVATDLRYFTHINPCGFTDRGATSIEKEIGRPVPMEEVKRRLVEDLCENLNVKIYK